MATIVTRAGKGSALTHTELDANFTNLNTDKIELTNLSVTDSGGDGSLAYNNSTGVITYTGPSAAEVRAHVSTTTASASGGGALAYNSSTGVFTFTPAVPGAATTINNNADNRVITGSGSANTLEGEANMTFDGSNAVISGSAGGVTSPILELVTDNSGWNRPALMFKDSNADVVSVVGENNTSQDLYVYNFTFDPNNTHGRTGVTTFAGDYFVGFAKNYSDQANITIDQNVYGAHGGYNLTVRGDFNSGGGNQYQYKPINLKGNEITLDADAGVVKIKDLINLNPVAYGNLNSSPSKGDVQFLTTDGGGSSRDVIIYYNGSDWKYLSPNEGSSSVVASS